MQELSIDTAPDTYELVWTLADNADGNKYTLYLGLGPQQKVNHFPGIFELGNKRWLNKNLKDARDRFGIV